MNCTSCGEENRENAKFCAECGTPIRRVCVSCDHPLTPTAKFCDECGTPVVPSTPADARADDGAVRRTVTIMFADLVGSTAFGEAVDAETARREMGAYHELARTVTEGHGGAVVKYIGDGVMIGFGVREVAEDDADRAVRAGLELQRRFEEITEGIRTRHGAEVSLRVGINTGEVVISEDDADMVGDPINTAARIEAQCTPGRVLVGEQTWRLTRSSVDYEVLGEVEVKGKSEPIATFQVLAAVEDEEVATPFVGREGELATLTAALENTIADGAPQLVTVIGSPGVGKTRLAAELAGRASEVTSFDLRVDRAGAATFEPVADLLRAVSELPAGLSDEATTEHLRAFVGEADDADRLVPLLAGFVGAAPLRSTEESFWAARRLVELVVATRPAVIVVDDIQWAEPLFLDLLEHLVEWTEGAAFVVALARPEIRDIRPAFAAVGRRVSEVIALEGLDPATMAELATGILGGGELPTELTARLPDSTEGNPLFVRELVRMLVDDEVIVESPSGWVLAIDAEAVDVPPTIISLLASRVERMDDDERRVVEAASVVGSEFARGAVGTLLPNLGAAQLDRILERLRRQEIVDPTGSYWGDEPVWRFHHVLIRDAAYRRLLKERRIDMHRRVGQWTEATATALGGEHEISIAFHYEQAHGYLRELGTDDDAATLGGRAAELLALAAERALARDDLASAGSLATRALGVLDDNDPRRAELLLSACEAWFGAGRVHDGAPHLDELRRRTGDDRIAAWTAAFEGQHVVLTEPDRLNEVEPIVADAAEQLAAAGDDAGVAKARLVRALILARTGRVGECENELDAALAAARAADDRRRITAVLGAAPLAALWGPSPVARAGGRCLDIVRLLRITSASPMVEAVSIRCQAVLEAMRGRFVEARTLIGRSQAIVEELGLRHGILECRMFAGYIELLAGNPGAAEPHLRVAHAGLGTLGVGADAGQAAALLSRSLLAQGRTDEAAEFADESARLAGQNLQTGIASRAAQAEIAAHQGRVADALRLADEAVAIGAETDLTMDHANALLSLAGIQHLHGDGRAADDSTRLAAQLFADKGAVVAEAPTREGFGFRSSTTDTLATRYARASSEALYDRRDVAAWEALCHPDSVFIDRRSLHDDTTDFAGLRELQLDRMPKPSSWDTALVATRGERLAVFANTMRLDDDPSEISSLNVLEVDDNGLLIASVLFDPHDHVGAINELTERFVVGEGAPFAHVIQAVRNHTVASFDDIDAFNESMTDDYRFVDHRALLQAVTDRDAPWAATDLDLRRLFLQRIDRLSDHGLVGACTSHSNQDAIEAEWSWILVQHVRDGRLWRTEIYDEADLELALDRFDSMSTAGTLTNQASHISRQFWSRLFDDLDVEAAMELMAGAVNDERALQLPDSTPVVMRQLLEESLVGVSRVEYDFAPIALRGDRHIAARVWGRYHPTEVEREIFTTARLEGGRLADVHIFDDVDDAYTALEASFREHEGAEFAEVLDAVSAQCRVLAELDVDATWDVAHRDCMVVDHRPLQQHETRLADMLDAHVETGMHGRMIVERFVRLNEHGAVQVDHSDFRDKDGIPVEFRTCQLRIIRDGKCAHFEVFPEHDVAAACARFDELTAPRALTNRAFEVNEEFFRRIFDDGDIDGAMTLVRPDWANSDERGLHLGDLDPASANRWFSLVERPDRWSTTAVAIRGDRVALSEIAVSATHERRLLLVSEIDASGLAIRDAQFELDQLRPALDLLNEWYLEGEGAPYRQIVELSRALGAAMEQDAEGQRAALLDLMHPDVVMHDHRSFGVPAMTSDHVRAGEGGILDVKDVVLVSEHLAINEHGMLGVADMRHTNEVGGQTVNRSLSLTVRRGDRASHLEWFDEDDREAALARFDELVAGRHQRADATYITTAERVADEMFSAFMNGDIEAFTSHLAPDFAADSARPLITGPMSRDFFLDALASYGRVYPAGKEGTVITRGDRHVVTTLSLRTNEGFETQVLLALEFDEHDQLRRLTSFDGAERDDAVARLDSWFVDQLDPAEGTAAELAAALQDRSGAERVLSPDFVGVDHRAVVGSSTDRAGYLDVMYSGVAGADFADRELEYHHLPRLTPQGVVAAFTLRSADEGIISDYCCAIVVDDGQVTRAEWFEADRLREAIRRFDELTAPPDDRAHEVGSYRNRCQHVVDRCNELLRAGDFEGVESLYHPDSSSFFAFDQLTLDRSGLMESLRVSHGGAEFGAVELETECLRSRGEHLSLARQTYVIRDASMTATRHVVREIDSDGRIVRGWTTDEDGLDDAMAILEEWWVESLDDATGRALELLTEWPKAAADGDGARLRSILADDMVALDHRPVSWGSGDREWFIDVQMEYYADPVEISLLHAPITTPTGGVIAASVSSPDRSREWHDAIVYAVDDGQVSRLEFYPGDRLLDAVARFGGLPESPTPTTSASGNRASAVDAAVTAAVRDRDMVALADLIADDAIFVDHRKITTRPVDTIEGIVESVHAYTDQSMTHSHDVVATYGDRVVFVEVTITSDTGFSVSLFRVIEIDDEGRVCRFETFDAEGFDAAQRCAAERWLDAEAPEARPGIEPLMDLSDAFGRNDFEAIAALLAPGFRHTVSKPLTAEGEFDAAGFLENMRVWVEMSGSIRNVTRAMVEWNRHGAVLVSEIHATDPTGMVTEWASAHVLIVADDKITHWEELEPHALDTAVARFRELTTARNRASDRIHEGYAALFEDHDLDIMLAMTHEDLVVEDRRPLVGLRIGREQFADNFRPVLEHDGPMDWEVITLAVRDDHLAVVRVTSARRGIDFPTDFLIVVEFDDDGLCTEAVTFDPADAGLALAELERRAADST